MAFAIVKSPLSVLNIAKHIRRHDCICIFLSHNLNTSSKDNSLVIPIQNRQSLLNHLKNKANDVVRKYEEFTGMDEVRLAQNRVLAAEEKFKLSQEKRRDINSSLSEIQGKLKDLFVELDNTTRGEDRYLYLITQEHKLLKEERNIQEQFKEAERDERENFAALSLSVKESHEKERAQAERTKYWSIIGSIIGTGIGIIGTTINNRFKMKELRQIIRDSTNADAIANLTALINEKADVEVDEGLKRALEGVNIRLQKVEVGLHSLRLEGSSVPNVSDNIYLEHEKTREMMIGLCLIVLVLPFISRLFF